MTCHDQCCSYSLLRLRSHRAATATAAAGKMPSAAAGKTPSAAGRRTRRGALAVWTTTSAVAAALLTLQLTAAASTGARDGDPMAAVASDASPAVAVTAAAAAPLEPAAAESKKVTGGKTAAMDGYLLTGSNKGDKGYNTDDVYGDKDADSYGFGTQVSYGNRAGDGGNGAYHHSTAYDDNGRSNPKFSAWHFEDKDGRPTKRYVFDSHKNKKNKPALEAEASEYDSVEAYDDGDDGSHAGYEVDDAEPEYGNLYDSADAYNDADTYY